MIEKNCEKCNKKIGERTRHIIVFTESEPIIVCSACWNKGLFTPKGEYNIYRSCRECSEMFYTRYLGINFCSEKCSIENKALKEKKTTQILSRILNPSGKILV